MDGALCGGAGGTLSGTALSAVKAAIFMGDPFNVVGLPYNVGTCKAKGVSTYLHNFSRFAAVVVTEINSYNSLPPAPAATSARPQTHPSSSLTATRPTLTAATATMPTRTSSTSTSTANRRLLLSRSLWMPPRLVVNRAFDLCGG